MLNIELLKNDVVLNGFNAITTIDTATTQNASLSLNGIVRVYCGEVATLTLKNIGIPVNTSNVSLSVEYLG